MDVFNVFMNVELDADGGFTILPTYGGRGRLYRSCARR